ncbi:MAG: hypothetical protein KAS32_28800 [Candidatus Peribacteraceae bacterium]|nr:hypothetical protein [Candidatus Peribacteraceae bacterium]
MKLTRRQFLVGLTASIGATLINAEALNLNQYRYENQTEGIFFDELIQNRQATFVFRLNKKWYVTTERQIPMDLYRRLEFLYDMKTHEVLKDRYFVFRGYTKTPRCKDEYFIPFQDMERYQLKWHPYP